jgi:hypothetical protein
MQILPASALPTTPGKGRRLKSSHDNRGIDECKRSEKKGETISLTSIFGGTSIY